MTTITHNDTEYEVSDIYRGDFTGLCLVDRKDMSNLGIYGSNFSHEEPDSEVFPPDMTGTKFINCNLDNCAIPKGNTVIGGSQARFKVQKDLRDWHINEKGEPISLVGEAVWAALGASVDPADIPDDFIRREILTAAAYNALIKDPEQLKFFNGVVPKVVSIENRIVDNGKGKQVVVYMTVEGPGVIKGRRLDNDVMVEVAKAEAADAKPAEIATEVK